ncbi:Rieske 2Fe-2S domain-containing protein [Polaribacter vadi]|jgi:nitrite reductase/ring-hydroxylating ferredoxin subunit|uniref:Rieske 2Fe-2S domain-containing protein n=1 Tax=Polaribacter vadi TaxID=1774273 RepID=UPI0030EF005E
MYKKIMLLVCITLFVNCSDTTNLTNCIRSINLSTVTDLNNPSMINAQTPGGFAELPGGVKGILLFNKNGTDFVAFDKLCPKNECTTPMVLEGRVLTCSCHESKYSVDFGGAPQTDGFECPAIEYKVTKNGSTIRISNF